MDGEIDLREYVQVLWRRRLLIAGVTVLGAAVALGISAWGRPPAYQATALLMVLDPVVYLPGPGLGGSSTGSSLGLSPEVLIALVRDGGLAAEAARRMPGGTIPPSDHATVTAVRRTNLLSVSAHAATAEGAFVLATAWTEALVASAERLAAGALRRVADALEPEVAAARRDVAAAESALREFDATSGLAEMERRFQESVRRIALLETMLAGRPGEASRGDSDQTRRSVGALRAEARRLQARMVDEQQQRARLAGAVEDARADLRVLLDQQRTLRIRQRTAAGGLSIVAPPARPSGPAPARRLSGPLFGAVLGFLAGIVVALSLESLRPRASVAP